MRRGSGIETARRKYRRHTQPGMGPAGTQRRRRGVRSETARSAQSKAQRRRSRTKTFRAQTNAAAVRKAQSAEHVLKPANRRIWNVIGAANRARLVNTAALHSTFAAARDRYNGMEKNNAPGSLKKSACGNACAAPTWGEEGYECTAKRPESAVLRPSGGESMGCCAFTNETQAKICARPF